LSAGPAQWYQVSAGSIQWYLLVFTPNHQEVLVVRSPYGKEVDHHIFFIVYLSTPSIFVILQRLSRRLFSMYILVNFANRISQDLFNYCLKGIV
jgi:hypothetical protein